MTVMTFRMPACRTAVLVIAGLVWAMACRRPGVVSAVSPDPEPLLIAVLRAVQLRTEHVPLLVDPRPVRAVIQTARLDSTVLSPGDPEEIASRSAAISAAGFRSADALTLPRCGPASAVYEPRGIHRGCPQSLTVIAMVESLNGYGGGADTSATVHAVTEERFPQGSALMSYAIAATRRDGVWTVQSVRLVAWRE